MQFVLFNEHFDVFVSQRHSSFKYINLFHGLPLFRFVNLIQTVQLINYETLVQFSRHC